jgi:hypothetical protein
MQGGEQVGVAELAAVEVGGRVGAPEERPEGGQAEVGAAPWRWLEDEAEGLPAIGMGATAAALSKRAEVGGRVVAAIAVLGGAGLGWGVVGELGEEGAAVLGDEQEDEAVGEAEELAVIVAVGEGAAAEGFVEGGVSGVLQEAVAEAEDRGLDAVAEAVERTHAVGADVLEPPLERAVAGACEPSGGTTRLWWQHSHSRRKSAKRSPAKIASRSNSTYAWRVRL